VVAETKTALDDLLECGKAVTEFAVKTLKQLEAEAAPEEGDAPEELNNATRADDDADGLPTFLNRSLQHVEAAA
jgi:hypothetical protein